MWLTDARDLAPEHAVIMLVGNKSDLEDEREVAFLEASRFAQENGLFAWIGLDCHSLIVVFAISDLLFLETSAKTGDGVEDMFFKCARSVISKAESGAFSVARGKSKTERMWLDLRMCRGGSSLVGRRCSACR
jgi:GTPase SAR1 family protein